MSPLHSSYKKWGCLCWDYGDLGCETYRLTSWKFSLHCLISIGWKIALTLGSLGLRSVEYCSCLILKMVLPHKNTPLLKESGKLRGLLCEYCCIDWSEQCLCEFISCCSEPSVFEISTDISLCTKHRFACKLRLQFMPCFKIWGSK